MAGSNLSEDVIASAIRAALENLTMNEQEMATYLRDNFVKAKHLTPRDRHEIEFTLQMWRVNETLDKLQDRVPIDSLKTRLKLYYYVVRYGWQTALKMVAEKEDRERTFSSQSSSSSFSKKRKRF